MKCTICEGLGELAGHPKCWYCRGTGYVDGADYVKRHHEHTAKQAASNAKMRQTHGKNGLQLAAIKDEQ